MSQPLYENGHFMKCLIKSILSLEILKNNSVLYLQVQIGGFQSKMLKGTWQKMPYHKNLN